MRPDGEPDRTLEVPGDGGFRAPVSRGVYVPETRLHAGQVGVVYPLTKTELVAHFRKYLEPRLREILQGRAYDERLQTQFNHFVSQYYQTIDLRFNVVCDTRYCHGVLYVEPHDLSLEENQKGTATQTGAADGPLT